MDNQKILIVESNESNQYAFRLFLENEGFQIINAHSIEETIKYIETEKFLAAFIEISQKDMCRDLPISKIKDLLPDMILVLISSFFPPEITLLSKKFKKLTLLEKPLSIGEIRKILKDEG